MSYSADLPAAAYVHTYLNEVSPALSGMFHLLLELVSGDSQKVKMAKELERQETYSLILGYGNGLSIDPKIREQHRKTAAKLKEQLAQIDLELDRLRYGKEGKTLAVASIAAGIIFIAHHAMEIGERYDSPVEGRDVIAGYKLKDFITEARNHAAHFAENKPRPKRAQFQKQVLNYDQKAEKTIVNYSYRLLEILKWRSSNDIRKDLLSLFDPMEKALWKKRVIQTKNEQLRISRKRIS
jgi:hypothetical protein